MFFFLLLKTSAVNRKNNPNYYHDFCPIFRKQNNTEVLSNVMNV